MIVTPKEMQAIESAVFARGVSAEALMESAGLAIADVVSQFFPTPGLAHCFGGKGNNAGDVFVAARILAQRGWEIVDDGVFPSDALSPLAAKKYAELQAVGGRVLEVQPRSRVVLDGLLGIGASGPAREPIAGAIRKINALRRNAHAFVISADIPSGLDGETGEVGDPCVEADCTVTIGFPKSGLLSDAATGHVGRLALANLPDLTGAGGDEAILITPELVRSIIPPRGFDSHKGTWGRVGIVAGSPSYWGAAWFCSASAVHAGAGLVTLFANAETAAILRTRCIPEVMVRTVTSLTEVLDADCDALAVGPGLGAAHDNEIREIAARTACPVVIDADGLNALSRHPGSLDVLARNAPCVLTPHPGEMARLLGGRMTASRRETAETFVADRPGVTLLLKGSRTMITEAGALVRFNTTGNPGMGSGGMGDVLTGVIAALMASGCHATDAASAGAWLCGRAAELAVSSGQFSDESLAASEVVNRLGAAFRSARQSGTY